LHHLVDVGVAGVIHRAHQVANAIAVDAVAKLDLRRHLVALGHGHVAHVIAKARELRALPVGPGRGRARPRAQAGLHIFIRPVAHHHLALQPQPAADEPKLAVAMRGLVQVHKVHVDLRPRNFTVVLGVQVRQRLRQRS